MEKTFTRFFAFLILLLWGGDSVGGKGLSSMTVSGEKEIIIFDKVDTDLVIDSLVVTVDSVKAKGIIVNALGGALDSSGQIFGAETKNLRSAVFPIEYKVYPNPFNNFIKIGNFDKLTKVIVTDITGRKVIEVENPEHIIQTDDLVSGLYFVSMYVGMDVVKASKLVKR